MEDTIMGIKSTAKKYYKKFKKAFTRNNNNETVTISGISRRGAVRRQMNETNVNNIPEISGNGAVENGIGSNQNDAHDLVHDIDLLSYGIDGNNTLSGQELGRISNLERVAQRFRNELETFIPELGTFIPEEDIEFRDETNNINYGESVEVESMVGEIGNVELDESIISESMDSYGERNGSIDSYYNFADRNNSLINGPYNNPIGRSNSAPIQNLTKKNSTVSLKSNRSQNSIY